MCPTVEVAPPCKICPTLTIGQSLRVHVLLAVGVFGFCACPIRTMCPMLIIDQSLRVHVLLVVGFSLHLSAHRLSCCGAVLTPHIGALYSLVANKWTPPLTYHTLHCSYRPPWGVKVGVRVCGANGVGVWFEGIGCGGVCMRVRGVCVIGRVCGSGCACMDM